MSQTILIVGSTNVDLVATTARLPRPGETVLGDGFIRANGGKGANQAVAAARSGGRVSMLGAVGTDEFGDACLAAFARDSIDTTFVTREDDLPTGVALITVDHQGENCIVVAPGANAALSGHRVEQAIDRLSEFAVCVCQLETPLDGVRAALTLASDRGAYTILNPAPAIELDDAILSTVNCLTPNESEAEILTGIRPETPEMAATAGKALLDRGLDTVIITLGPLGAVLVDGSGHVYQPAPEVAVADTTAAGDTFTGCLAASIASGKTARASLAYACAGASLCVTRSGAQPSIPTRDEIVQFHDKLSQS